MTDQRDYLEDGVQQPLALFEAMATPRSLGAGAILIDEGGASADLHLLAEGWACRYVTTPDGGRQILAILLPGDFCNLDGLALARSDYGIRTLTPATVLGVPRTRALALAAERADVMRLFLRRVAIENAMLGRCALALGRQSAEGGLAHLLCELAVRLGAAREPLEERACGFEMPLTQEQLGDVLGLTGVHVNRTLRQLRARSLVDIHGRHVSIPDMAALASVAGFDPAYLHRTDARPRRTPAARAGAAPFAEMSRGGMA